MAISLEKGKKVNLRKQEKKGLGEILVNLNWNNKPAKKGFLGSLFGGGSKPIDLDLGCLYELKNGRKGTVQALGNDIILVYKASEYEGTLHSSDEGEVYWIDKEDFLNQPLATGMEYVWDIVHKQHQECIMSNMGEHKRGDLF